MLIVGCCQIKIGIVIPARLESERLPRKVLLNFLGKPMLEHVWRRAIYSLPEIETVVITPNNQIIELCKRLGAQYKLTSENHENALSRIGEAAQQLKWDYYIVLQADEVLIDPESLKLLYISIKKNLDKSFFNLVSSIKIFSEIEDRNIVKCLTNSIGDVLYIFRKSPLISKKKVQLELVKRICGVYAISAESLNTVCKAEYQVLEKSESIEQLRILELGLNIFPVSVERNYPSVNTKNDINKVNQIIKKDSYQISLLNRILL